MSTRNVAHRTEELDFKPHFNECKWDLKSHLWLELLYWTHRRNRSFLQTSLPPAPSSVCIATTLGQVLITSSLDFFYSLLLGPLLSCFPFSPSCVLARTISLQWPDHDSTLFKKLSVVPCHIRYKLLSLPIAQWCVFTSLFQPDLAMHLYIYRAGSPSKLNYLQ